MYHIIRDPVSSLTPSSVAGFFGARKTRAVVNVAVSRPGPIIVISEPLRILRDSVTAMYKAIYGRDPPVLRAHDEVCQDLLSNLAKGYSYYEALSM